MDYGDRVLKPGGSNPPDASSALLADATPPGDKSEPKPEKIQPSAGSYYQKVASSRWDWKGIETVVRLGEPHVDAHRVNRHGIARDGFTTYIGGNAGPKTEIDAGLTWEHLRLPNGKPDLKHQAWRPFYRNEHWHSPFKEDCYWKPGELVSMSLNITSPGHLHLRIADPGNSPKRFIDLDIPAKGFAAGENAEFKRVTSLDQTGNEGQTVKPTHSFLVGTEWLSVNMLHGSKDQMERLPLTGVRRATLEIPAGHIATKCDSKLSAAGGEYVDIYGSKLP